MVIRVSFEYPKQVFPIDFKEKEVIFESDDVTEVIDKAKELFGQCERNMINNHIKCYSEQRGLLP